MASTPAVSAPPAAKAPAPSKVIFSAAVRLYKLNPYTNGYDAHENGQPLGMVVVGSGSVYNILIYNAQKAHQCVVPITMSFQFVIRDLYMSITDTQGVGWSILFDSYEVLANLVRHTVVIMSHLWSQADSDAQPSEGFYKSILPSSASMSGSDDDVTIGSGMTTGLYYSVWEISDSVDYATDILSQKPFVSLQAPDDVLKAKYVLFVFL